jgi:hypothetical protein
MIARGEWLGSCQVYAEVPAGKEFAYGEVYARAVKKFATGIIVADQICREAQPQAPLNESWALRHGFEKYFAEPISMPCEDCGAVERPVYHGLLWANRVLHARGQRHLVTFYLTGGQERSVGTYICRSCEAKIDATGTTISSEC